MTGCTFAPKTGRPPKEDAAPKQPFPDRLYRQRDGKYAQVRLNCCVKTLCTAGHCHADMALKALQVLISGQIPCSSSADLQIRYAVCTPPNEGEVDLIAIGCLCPRPPEA